MISVGGEPVNKKLYLLMAAVALASMVLAACGPAPAATSAPGAPAATAAPAKPKVITLGFSQESDNVVTFFTAMTYSVYIGQMTLVGLGEWDDKNNFVPELATDVPTAENGGVSADGLTITWHLKPGLKWSDGEPLTSADVKFTWQAVMDPKTACTAC